MTNEIRELKKNNINQNEYNKYYQGHQHFWRNWLSITTMLGF